MVEKIIADDHAAFTMLYERYQPIVFRFVKTFVKSSEVSRDICQDVFIKLWDARHTLGGVKSFQAFVLTMARNHTLNILKRIVVEQHLKARFIRGFIEGRNDVDDEIQSAEYRCYIVRILQTLPPHRREMFELCRMQGKTYDEAAEAMGLSRNTIKKHMVSSMKTLRYAVQKDLGIFFLFLTGVTL